MSTEIKPFTYSDLPKFSRNELQINNLFYSSLFTFEHKEKLIKNLSSMFNAVLNASTSVMVDTVTTLKLTEYLNLTSEKSAICVLAVPPNKGVFFVEIPLKLAKFLIYNALGKEGSPPNIDQQLTAVERGILTYVVLKVFSVLKNGPLNIDETSLNFLKILEDKKEISSFAKDADTLTSTSFDIKLNNESFSWQLLLTAELAKSLALSTKSYNKNLSYLLAQKRTFTVKVPVIAEIGQVALHEKDFKALETDDIIVLDDSALKLNQLGLTGNIYCKIGENEFGSFDGNLLLTKSGRYAVQIKEIHSAKDIQASQNSGTKTVK